MQSIYIPTSDIVSPNTTGKFAGQTSTNLVVVTLTPTTSGPFSVNGYVKATKFTLTANVILTLTWTDEASSSQSIQISPTITHTGFYSGTSTYLRAMSGTAITVTLTYTGSTVTYDTGATITKLS